MFKNALVPLWLKLVYTVFVAVLVPTYWHYYGPGNFLYFCDMALLLTLAGLWREDRLLTSMGACGILAPQILWVLDFAAHAFGLKITGMTDYMFADSSVLLRGLSLFHGWLPFLLVYLVWRLGYDRRALVAWTALAWGAMLVSYVFLPPPSAAAGMAAANVDYVFGPSDAEPQHWMAPTLWLLALMSALLTLFWIPSHWVLSKWRGAEVA